MIGTQLHKQLPAAYYSALSRKLGMGRGAQNQRSTTIHNVGFLTTRLLTQKVLFSNKYGDYRLYKML